MKKKQTHQLRRIHALEDIRRVLAGAVPAEDDGIVASARIHDGPTGVIRIVYDAWSCCRECRSRERHEGSKGSRGVHR